VAQISSAAAPASSTATTAATGAAASPAAGTSSLYSINTHGPPADEGKESAPNGAIITKSLSSVKGCISPSSSKSDQKFDGISVSGKCNYESGSRSNSFLVGASKQQAASFREAYGRSGSEDDNASGVGYNPPGDDRGDTFGCNPPCDNSSGAEEPSSIKGIINVNAASAAPASSTAATPATAATGAAASPAAGTSSL